jgi:hypothetical protein
MEAPTRSREEKTKNHALASGRLLVAAAGTVCAGITGRKLVVFPTAPSAAPPRLNSNCSLGRVKTLLSPDGARLPSTLWLNANQSITGQLVPSPGMMISPSSTLTLKAYGVFGSAGLYRLLRWCCLQLSKAHVNGLSRNATLFIYPPPSLLPLNRLCRERQSAFLGFMPA